MHDGSLGFVSMIGCMRISAVGERQAGSVRKVYFKHFPSPVLVLLHWTKPNQSATSYPHERKLIFLSVALNSSIA